MPKDMKAWEVRRVACDVVWHLHQVATTLEHALGSWSGVAALVQNSPAGVRNERARCMNIIGGACVRLNRVLEILSGREGRYAPEVVLENLIKCCEIGMADLKVGRLRHMLEEAAHDTGKARRKSGLKTEPTDANT